MSSKNYDVAINTKVDEKSLNALIKKLQKMKSDIKIGTVIDDKEIKKLQTSIADIGKKPVEVKIDTAKTKKDLDAVEKQIDRVAQKSKGIKTTGGGIASGGITTVGGTPQVGGSSNTALAASLAAVSRSSIKSQEKLVKRQQYLAEVQARSAAAQARQPLVQKYIQGPNGNLIQNPAWRPTAQNPPSPPPAPTPTRQPSPPPSTSPRYIPNVTSRPTTTSASGGVAGALVGMEVFEKFNFLMTSVATNYETVANNIQDTNSDLADSLRVTANNIKDTTKLVQGVASGGILGGALGGAKGGLAGAVAGGGLALAMKYFSEYQDAIIEVTRSEANLKNTHTKLTEAFRDLQSVRGEKMMEAYNKTLQHTIDLENELTSVKLHQQDEELAKMYDTLQLEKERIENKKKLISDSQIPESQKIQELSTLNEQLDYLQSLYDVEAAGAPVAKLKTTLSGLSDTFTPIAEALGETAEKLNTVKTLSKRLTEIDSILGDASVAGSKLFELDTRESDIRTKPQFMRGVFGTSSQRAEKDRLALEEISTERAKLLKLQEEGKGLTEERNRLKEELKKYFTEEQLQQEIQSLQQQKDSLQKQINDKGIELDQALTTEARVKANLEAQGVSRGLSRGIERVSQLANAGTDGQLQARLDADLTALNEKLGNVSGIFDRLRSGASVGKQGGLTSLESAITQAIKDGIIATPEFVGITKQATGLGITGDTEFKRLLQSLYDIAKVQGTGNKILPAAQQAMQGVDNQVAEYIKQIIGDREINAQELAGLQELLANSGKANSEAMNRLIAIAENNLSANTQLIDRITKIEAGLKIVNGKLK